MKQQILFLYLTVVATLFFSCNNNKKPPIQKESVSSQDSIVFGRLDKKYNDASQKKDYTEALHIAKEYYDKATHLKNEEQQGKGAVLLSTVHFETDSLQQAENWYAVAQKHLENAGNHTWKGHGNLNAGRILTKKYDFEKGISFLLKAVEDFERAGDYALLVRTYLSISLSYHDFGDYKKGIAYANLALKTLDTYPDKTPKNYYWYAYNNMGINYDDNKQYEDAIKSHLKALPYAANASDSSYSFNNLGNTNKKLGNYKIASEYFEKALMKGWKNPDDVYHLATVYSNLLDIERLQKKYKQAETHIDSASYYAQKSKSPEKLMDYYYYTHTLEKETGNYKAATENLNQYVVLKDSLLNAEKAKIVYNYQIKYETEKKEKEIANTRLKSEQKNVWLILLGSAIVIGLGIFRNYSIKSRLKQKQLSLEYQLLQEQAQSQIQQQRLEISRDLHDSLGAQLTFMGSVLDSIKSSPHLDEKTNSKINTLSDFSENSVSELKSVLWVLNSDEILMQDLKLKLLNFIKNAGEAKEDLQFAFDFDAKEDFRLSSKLAVNIFRVSQEIINNAMKYAKATELKIEMHQNEKTLHLQISDNGTGFDLEKEKSKSFGLSNIQKRIEEIGGNLLINIDNGTTFKIDIPLSL